ncbi:MAG: hypothetical protein A2167_03845 [Planctomycetes bacterium RBG_13_46_10]|nr:MAG: hypothetical protein A2167_03845 [Planctomycetes bacterium RBG_13_46_10]
MRKILFTLLPLFFLFGCAWPKYNYHPTVTEINEPPLNTVVTAYIGDTMLSHGQSLEQDAIYLQKNTKMGLLAGFTLTSGYYLKKGEDAKSEYYLPAGGVDSGHVIINPILADPFQVIRLDKKSGKLCAVSEYNMEECTKKAVYERRKYPVASPGSFQQCLIYNGKSGDKIYIGYREVTADLARPALNNDVEYDLTRSKIITYQNARIKVIEATSEYIKYSVLENLNGENKNIVQLSP